MSIFLFTDFGAADLYAGQVRAVLQRDAPNVAVIDLLHDAPAFNVRAGAHLLAAISMQLPSGSVTLAVVDPGVGGARDAVALAADNNWYIGPDNGLLSVLAARARARTCWRITWRPEQLSASFHGRDLFAPVAAAIACGEFPAGKAESGARLSVDFDLEEIIYIDHYGNVARARRTCRAMRASSQPAGRSVMPRCFPPCRRARCSGTKTALASWKSPAMHAAWPPRSACGLDNPWRSKTVERSTAYAVRSSSIERTKRPSPFLSARVTARVVPNVGMYAECLPAPPTTMTMKSSAACNIGTRVSRLAFA